MKCRPAHWYVSLPIGAVPPNRFYNAAARAGDVIFGLIGMALLLILAPLVWIGNRLWSPGPLFYSQLRVGRAGSTYRMVKFRTMVPDAEKLTGAVWAKHRDPRVTSFGNLLRRSRLDELPQVWNILRGEMGLICLCPSVRSLWRSWRRRFRSTAAAMLLGPG